MRDVYLQPDAQKLMDEHLFSVEHAMAQSGVPGEERRTVIDALRGQILEMLAERRFQNVEAVSAVLQEVAPPESYASPGNGVGMYDAQKATTTRHQARHGAGVLACFGLFTFAVAVLAFYHFLVQQKLVDIYEQLGARMPHVTLLLVMADESFWRLFPLTLIPLVLFFLPLYFVVAYARKKRYAFAAFFIYIALIMLLILVMVLCTYIALFNIPKTVN